MISYREKQLLMVMKMLQDDTAEITDTLNQALDAAENRLSLPSTLDNRVDDVKDFNTLVEIAEEKGYDMYVRASDILSKEELEDLERRKDEIEAKFKSLTKLKGVDQIFVIAAIALQILRQVIQPRLDFESLDPKNRENDKKAADQTDKSKTKEKIEDAKKKAENNNIDLDKSKQYYYASVADIADLSHVPYDAIIPGLSGKTHRFKTLGHDPILGYVFGTCNILTNTLTTSDMRTVHIKNNQKYADADTVKMFEHCRDRFSEKGGKVIIGIAIAKQTYHIKSDQKSKAGIGLPFLQLLCDEKVIRKLCDRGIDYNAMEFLGTVAKQGIFAELINFVVATTHRMIIAKEEFDEFCDQNHIVDEKSLKAVLQHKGFHDIIFGNESLNEVRTRKILLISNCVASAANIIYTGIGVASSVYTENPEGVTEALNKLDIGGILVTLKHLICDSKVILKIKDDFIVQAINSDFEAKMLEIEKDGQIIC